MPVIAAQDDGHPNANEVRDALCHMAASEAFRGSPQLVAFLRYVVEATLRGEQDRIKGYTIAVEALGRSENFDPQDDPIVRVEATRLRRALNRYYENGGRQDPVQIDLPLGSYVPVFRRSVPAAAPACRAGAGVQDSSRARPAVQEFLLFLAAYVANDAAGAARHAALITSDDDPLGLVARVLVAAQHGEADAARAMLDRLVASGPAAKT
ncbi:MAG: hypothetical protein E6G97_20440 [Alphaproteobacteria bacterium]|nr:MAG: hypothetical protein E6G97_20440 [Alphaproteobacteria bacterium]